MKKTLKFVLIFSLIMVLCCLIMVGSSYLYLEISLNSAETDTSESNIPYSAPLPDSSGLLLSLPDNSGYMVFLDFSGECITVAKIDKLEDGKKDYFGYPVSFTINTDYRTLAGLIDRVGGIEIHDSKETLRYTGTQVIEKIHSTSENKNLTREAIKQFFIQITENGFSKEDFVYIIENSDTDITVPDIYYWPPYIADIAQSLQFIN